MRTLVFTSLFPNNIWPHHGVFVKERIARLAKLSESNVTVVAPVPYFPNWKISDRWRYSQVFPKETIEELEVRHPRYFMIPKIAMSSHGCLMAFSVLPVIRSIQKKFAFDVIDAHYVYPDGFAAVMLGRILHKPVVITARGSDINLFAGFRSIRPLLSYCLRRANRVIAVSQALSASIAALGISKDQIYVISNGVDKTKFHRIPDAEARQFLGLPRDKKIILSVGGLVELKGFDILIRAMSLLCLERNRKDLCLLIAGDGPVRPQLQQLIDSLGLAGSVFLAGDIPHSDLYRWYSAANLFCLASSREGWPNVILEALACGTPVLATNVGGVPEIINSQDLGWLCNRDEASFASRILDALAYPWDHQYIMQSAAKHSWDASSQAVFNVLASAVASYN